jgi:hypothetical protein
MHRWAPDLCRSAVEVKSKGKGQSERWRTAPAIDLISLDAVLLFVRAL